MCVRERKGERVGGGSHRGRRRDVDALSRATHTLHRHPEPEACGDHHLRGGVQGSGCRVQGFRMQVSGVQGASFRRQGAGFRVQGAGCMVHGSGCRVQPRNQTLTSSCPRTSLD